MTDVPGTTPHRSGGPLSHLTVLDLTQHLAGPFATQILGDLGARIIKVEPPCGDPTRQIGPHFVDGDSAYFLSTNRNKESICLDLKMPAAHEVLVELVRHADVVVENFRPGTMDRLNLGYEALAAINPRVVLCSISGFGQDGPWRDRPAFDMVVQALSGGMSLTGESDGVPVRSGLPIGDLCAGMYGVIGILAALSRAESEGIGSHVDVAMLDAQVSMLSYVGAYFLVGGHVAGLQGRAHMSIPTYRAFTCKDDRDIVVTANTPRMWSELCAALDVPELVNDERFADNEVRRSNRRDLDALLDAAAVKIGSPELLDRLNKRGVPCAPINRVDEALSSPQVRHRDMVVEASGPGTPFRTIGNPVRVSPGGTDYVRPPHLGQHTAQVLGTLGLDDEAIRKLHEEGGVRSFSSDGTTA